MCNQAAFLSAGGYHHHLGINTWSPGPSATDNQSRLVEWVLVVTGAEDVAAIGGRIVQVGRLGGRADVVDDHVDTVARRHVVRRLDVVVGRVVLEVTAL